MTAQFKEMNAKMEKGFEKANAERAAGDAALGERIEKLSEKVSTLSDGVAEIRSSQKALFLLLSTAAIVASGASLARTFGWI
jgi:hypothetical protein